MLCALSLCTLYNILSRLKIAWLFFFAGRSSPSNAARCNAASHHEDQVVLVFFSLVFRAYYYWTKWPHGLTVYIVHWCLGNHNFIFTSIDLQMRCHQEGYDHESGLGDFPQNVELLMTLLMSLPGFESWTVLVPIFPDRCLIYRHVIHSTIAAAVIRPNKQYLIAAATGPASHGLNPRLTLISLRTSSKTGRAATSAKTKPIVYIPL